MSPNKRTLCLLALILAQRPMAQHLNLDTVIDSIRVSHPVIRMYENEIRSMDEAARGARSWMPPQVGVGFFMTPYNINLWKKEGDMTGMGSVMVSGEQMFPNRKKLDADEAYMTAMSSSEKMKKNASLNELVHDAKRLYYNWVILEKKLAVLTGNEKILDFMIRNAEIRYKNGLEKINAYYKAKASLGAVRNMQIMYETEIREMKYRLNSLMGRRATTDFSIDTGYSFRNFAGLNFDSTLFYGSRSDLKAIDQDINLAHLKQQTEQMNLKPQFGIRYDNMFGFGGQPMLYTLMGMMRIPMAGWSNKMNKANMEALRWKAGALQSQKEMLVNEYSGMAYAMLNELNAKKKQLTVYTDQIIPALKKKFLTIQLAYEQNTEELFMLYDAWESLNMTQIEYLDILNQALRLQTDLERLLEYPEVSSNK
jgi:outer membrane protein TolC